MSYPSLEIYGAEVFELGLNTGTNRPLGEIRSLISVLSHFVLSHVLESGYVDRRRAQIIIQSLHP